MYSIQRILQKKYRFAWLRTFPSRRSVFTKHNNNAQSADFKHLMISTTNIKTENSDLKIILSVIVYEINF